MSQERSADWLRGAVHVATQCGQGKIAGQYQMLIAEAEAEAREALQGGKERMALSRIYQIASRQLAEPAGRGNTAALVKICTEVEAVQLLSEADAPTAAEVIASAEKALEGALALDPHCDHAYTYRAGAIWTICDDCGKEWADDKGGFKPDKPNKHILKIEEALALIAKWKEAQRLLEGQ